MAEYLHCYIKYEFCCPVNIFAQEHKGSDKRSSVYNHLSECGHFNYLLNLHMGQSIQEWTE